MRMSQLSVVHYSSYFRTDRTHPFAASMMFRFVLQTQASELVLVIIKNVIAYPGIVRCRKRVGLRASY